MRRRAGFEGIVIREVPEPDIDTVRFRLQQGTKFVSSPAHGRDGHEIDESDHQIVMNAGNREKM